MCVSIFNYEKDGNTSSERLMGQWTSPIYVFFEMTPSVEYIGGRRAQVFECAAQRCNGKNGRDVSRFLDEGDRKTFVGMPRLAGF